MINNDILRRLRYSFELRDQALIDIFALTGMAVSKEQVVGWLTKEGEEAFVELSDHAFATFLNGFIILKRGARDGEPPVAESRLNNNLIFQKLRIALNLKAEDILAILQLVEFNLSKHELSAFFRKPDNKHYRECQNQVLRNFLMGLQLQLRPKANPTDPAPE